MNILSGYPGKEELQKLIDIYTQAIDVYKETKNFAEIEALSCDEGICKCALAHYIPYYNKYKWYGELRITGVWLYVPVKWWKQYGYQSVLQCLVVRLERMKSVYTKFYE